MAFLLDTHVVAELRRPKPHGAVLAWLHSVDDADLHLARAGVVTVASHPARSCSISSSTATLL